VRAPQVRRVERKSRSKLLHIIHITHRDEAEPPVTDWLQEAYSLPDTLATGGRKPSKRREVRREAQHARDRTMTRRRAARIRGVSAKAKE
jgi:hypothetical protein